MQPVITEGPLLPLTYKAIKPICLEGALHPGPPWDRLLGQDVIPYTGTQDSLNPGGLHLQDPCGQGLTNPPGVPCTKGLLRM